jgi:hypothetical protein
MNDDNRDYLEFINTPDVLPPREMDNLVLSEIKNKLDPTSSLILLKLSIVHAFMGSLTMVFCPQFEMSLTANQDAFHFFHRTFGYHGCLAICGMIFLGSGALFASLIFKRDEVRKINSKFYFFFPTLCLLSLGLFFVLGARPYIDIVFSWSAGGILGSILIFYFTSVIKGNFLSQKKMSFFG